MTLSLRVATVLTRFWVRVYTLGLDTEARRNRLALLESDLWEQTHDRGLSSHVGVSLSILGRCLSGMPADLAWRYQAQAGVRQIAIDSGAMDVSATTVKEANLAPVAPALGGLAWAMVAVNLISPVPHSLAFAGAVLAVIALAGWALEIRADEEDGAGTSLWPLTLAGGVFSIAAGLIVKWEFGGLLVSLPLALALTKAWLAAASTPAAVSAPANVPVSGAILSQRAAAGDAIALEQPQGRQVSRRAFLRSSIWVGLGSALAAGVGGLVDYLWERKPSAFGGVVVAGSIDSFPPGSKTHVVEGKFWLVHLTAEQGGPGFLALWHKCPHLGCTVPWMEEFRHKDPVTGRATRGWFRCPCHQSTYNHAGVRVFGPAPRSMDRMEVRIDQESRRIEVDTGRITRGAPDNAAFAVTPPQ